MGPNLIRTSKFCLCFKENGWGWVDFLFGWGFLPLGNNLSIKLPIKQTYLAKGKQPGIIMNVHSNWCLCELFYRPHPLNFSLDKFFRLREHN